MVNTIYHAYPWLKIRSIVVERAGHVHRHDKAISNPCILSLQSRPITYDQQTDNNTREPLLTSNSPGMIRPMIARVSMDLCSLTYCLYSGAPGRRTLSATIWLPFLSNPSDS